MSAAAADAARFTDTGRCHQPTRFFRGRTVFCIGSGPAGGDVPVGELEGLAVICCNREYERFRRALVVFADRRFLGWHQHVMAQRGDVCVTSTPTVAKRGPCPTIYRMERLRNGTDANRKSHFLWSDRADTLCGIDAGCHAVSLAVRAGAWRVVLVGYDMRFRDGRAHRHDGHPIRAMEGNYRNEFTPQYPILRGALAHRGVDLVVATPSALDLPEVDFEAEVACARHEEPL